MAPKSEDTTFLNVIFVIFLVTAVAGLPYSSSSLGVIGLSTPFCQPVMSNGDRGGDGAGNAENLKGSLGSGFYGLNIKY